MEPAIQAPKHRGYYERAFLADRRTDVATAAVFPKSRGKPRVDDQRVLSGIIYVKKNGLQWKDAPSVYGPSKTLYNRFVRWSRMGVFARIFVEFAQPGPDGDVIMIDSTHLKAHRTAASLSKGGLARGPSDGPRAG